MHYSKPELTAMAPALDTIGGWKWPLFCSDADASILYITIAAYDLDE